MTESAKQAWGEVGEKFSSWGRRVADRYQREGSTGNAEVDEAERELTRAMKEVFDEVSRGVSAVGATLKDDRAKEELSEAVSALGNAISATVSEASEAIRSKGGPTPPAPPPPADG